MHINVNIAAMKTIASSFLMMLALTNAFGTSEARMSNKPSQNTLLSIATPSGGKLRFRSKSKLPPPTIENVEASFTTGGDGDGRFPDSCFDDIKYIEILGHTCEAKSLAPCCQKTTCTTPIDSEECGGQCKDEENCCKPETSNDGVLFWDAEEDFPKNYIIEKEEDQNEEDNEKCACERKLDSKETTFDKKTLAEEKLFYITCGEINELAEYFKYRVIDESVKKYLMEKSTYEVTHDKFTRCAPVNLMNDFILESTQSFFDNVDRRVCYLGAKANQEEFRFRVCGNLKVKSVDSGTVTFESGATCALTPEEDMFVFDFEYNAETGSITKCHLGHNVKDLVIGPKAKGKAICSSA
eukprot:g1557.t1